MHLARITHTHVLMIVMRIRGNQGKFRSAGSSRRGKDLNWSQLMQAARNSMHTRRSFPTDSVVTDRLAGMRFSNC